MRILIDIGHPAHVHLFKHFAHEMLAKEHKVKFTCRHREHVISLLEHEGLDFECLGSNFRSAFGKLWGLIYFTCKILFISRRFKPDILLSHSSMYAAFVGFLTGKPHISFEDTFNFEQIRLYKPFTKAILTGDYDHPLKSKKVIRFAGYHELAYLHPKRFKPDISVLKELGLKKEDEPFVILRFVAWSASHDRGHAGISNQNKRKAVQQFSKYARVLISSESPLSDNLSQHAISIPPHHMHDALAYASLIFSESATMVAEAAMAGTPGIYLDNTGRLYTKEVEEKYGLCFNYSESEADQQKAIEKGVELLQTKNLKATWQKKRDTMLKDKIDVTAFLVWFVENWPESFKVMKEKPGYCERFR